MRSPLSFRGPLLACLLACASALAADPLVLEGEVPTEGGFFSVPFEVPPGTVELEVRHDDLASENILDWGLEDPEGFRGYGGGNEEPAIVGEKAASRSYLAGPLRPGTWKVTVGKAKIRKTPARYRIEVHLHTAARLAPQPERQPYHPVDALSSQPRWYAGDFHVHSRESGDAKASLDEIARYARGHGLDFVVLTEHNTTSTLDFLVDAQSRSPDVLLVPGVEYTTYSGHANAIGATRYVPPRVNEGITLEEAIDAFHRQGALFSINHPVYDVGDLCIGCAWQLTVPPSSVDAIEVANGGWEKLGRFFSEGAISYWDWLLSQGQHTAALGGSDDHRAGVDLDFTQSALGNPTTLVYARELSVAALLEGIRNNRTVVKLQGPEDPMVDLTSSVAPTGDTVLAPSARLSARVTGAQGHQVRFVHNGVRLPLMEVTSEDFVVEQDITAPEHGEDRFRVEVWINDHPRTVTSHLWIARTADMRGIPGPVPKVMEPGACGCGSAPGWSAGVLALTVLALGRRGRKAVRPHLSVSRSMIVHRTHQFSDDSRKLHHERRGHTHPSRCSRVGSLAVAVLMLLNACATKAPLGGGPTSPEAWTLESEADDEGTGEGEFIFASLPTGFQSVQVGDSELTSALATLWLNMPLEVSTSCPPLYIGRKLALASTPLNGEVWQSDLARAYGQYCKRRGHPGDCLTLFEDGPRLQADDKRSLALALAVGPALEGLDAEVRAMLNPTQVLATLSITITAYMALLLAPVPEPVTKGVATAFTLLMWGYLGWEFFDLLRAYAQLYDDAPRASTFAELREVGEKFGKVIGPNSVRILVMVATAAIGETAALLSKGPKLPGLEHASRTVELNTGLRLMETATGAERVIVSLNEGTLRVVLPINAVSMTAWNGDGGRSALNPGSATKGDAHLPNGHRAFKSFRAFKRHMGKAGEGKEWHHIVEKRNAKRFGAEAVHNTENVIPLEKPVHDRVSALYSSIQENITRSAKLTVRQWLDTQSYEAQRAFGLLSIENVRNGVW